MKYIKTYEANKHLLKVGDIITFPYDIKSSDPNKTYNEITAFEPYVIHEVIDEYGIPEYLIYDDTDEKFYVFSNDKDIIYVHNLNDLEQIKNMHNYNI